MTVQAGLHVCQTWWKTPNIIVELADELKMKDMQRQLEIFQENGPKADEENQDTIHNYD